MRYPRKVRKKVKTICIDIYPPYMNIIRERFPNAEVIIDRFHMVQNINRELNKARVKLMNQYKNKKRLYLHYSKELLESNIRR